MKKSIPILIAIAVAFMLYACRRTEEQQPPNEGAKENVFVYNFEPFATKTVDDSKKLIEKVLGSRDVGDLYKSDDNTVYFTSKDDVSETFENDLNNGNFTFNRSMKQYMGTATPQLPGREEAIRLAEEFLNKNGLMPKNRNELTLAHYGGLRAAAVIDGKTAGPVIDKLITISYSRKVDDLPVLGPGSKVVINVGNKGEIMGAIYRWRELATASRKQVQTTEAITQAEAEELAKRQIMSEFGEGTTYKFGNSGKAYYDNNRGILQPVYMFETTVTLKDQKIPPFPYLCVIQLLRNSPEPLNLTALDPRAKESLKTIRQGETPVPGEKKPID